MWKGSRETLVSKASAVKCKRKGSSATGHRLGLSYR